MSLRQLKSASHLGVKIIKPTFRFIYFRGDSGTHQQHPIALKLQGLQVEFASSQAQRTFCFEAILNFDWTPGVGVIKVSAE
jgi:hypothetical protein